MHECSGGDDHMTLTILHQAEHFSLSVHQPTHHHQTREKIPPTHRDSLDIPTALFWIFGRTLVCAWTELCLDWITCLDGICAWTEFGRNLCLDGIMCLDGICAWIGLCAWMDYAVLEDYGGL